MADFTITQNHLLAKIGQQTMEIEVLRAQLQAAGNQINALQEAKKNTQSVDSPAVEKTE